MLDADWDNLTPLIYGRPSRQIPKDSVFAPLRDMPRVRANPTTAFFDDEEYEQDPLKGRMPPAVDWPTDHPAARHLGWGQNDAVILGVEIESNVFRLTFNHYDVERLAAVLSHPWRAEFRSAFPVTLHFEEVSELHILRMVEHWAVQHIRSSRSGLSDALCDIIDLNPIATCDDGAAFTLEMNGGRNGWRAKRPKHSPIGWYHDVIVVCLTAKELRVSERYREGWVRLFGEEDLWILDRFESVWPVPGWAVPDFENFLIEAGAFVQERGGT